VGAAGPEIAARAPRKKSEKRARRKHSHLYSLAFKAGPLSQADRPDRSLAEPVPVPGPLFTSRFDS